MEIIIPIKKRFLGIRFTHLGDQRLLPQDYSIELVFKYIRCFSLTMQETGTTFSLT